MPKEGSKGQGKGVRRKGAREGTGGRIGRGGNDDEQVTVELTFKSEFESIVFVFPVSSFLLALPSFDSFSHLRSHFPLCSARRRRPLRHPLDSTRSISHGTTKDRNPAYYCTRSCSLLYSSYLLCPFVLCPFASSTLRYSHHATFIHYDPLHRPK